MISQQLGERLGIGQKKLFVLDTNVILHDSTCLWNFEEHDILLPITVLEELDQFKKGHEEIHFHARQFLRELDQLTGDILSPQGASLGPERGQIRIVLSGELDERTRTTFVRDSADHRILGAALSVQTAYPHRQTIMVSKDTNLRMKAKALGLQAQDYSTDRVANTDALPSGKRIVADVDAEVLRQFFSDGCVPADQLAGFSADAANEFLILRNGSQSVLACYRPELHLLERITRTTLSGVSARNAEQAFAMHALTDDRVPLVTIAGRAGSGKTLIALAAALTCRREYRQILLARPIVPLSNRDLGYLPGDIQAKIDPYMQPLFDNLSLIRQLGKDTGLDTQLDRMVENDKLEVTPLAYIRGRTLHRVYFIVDEAQNLTPHEIKTIITRAGEGTKVVFTGDVQQIDHPYLDSLSNGLSYLIHRMINQPLYAHITFEKGERSELSKLASRLL